VGPFSPRSPLNPAKVFGHELRLNLVCVVSNEDGANVGKQGNADGAIFYTGGPEYCLQRIRKSSEPFHPGELRDAQQGLGNIILAVTEISNWGRLNLSDQPKSSP